MRMLKSGKICNTKIEATKIDKYGATINWDIGDGIVGVDVDASRDMWKVRVSTESLAKVIQFLRKVEKAQTPKKRK